MRYESEEEDEGGQVKLETGIGRIKSGSTDFFYRVTNGTEHTILLMTPMLQFDKGRLRAAPSRMYAYVDPDGILQLTKRLWPLPEQMDVVFPEVPLATEVLPGKTFEERLSLALPVQVEIPYLFEWEESEKSRESVIAVAGGLAFSIGYMVESEGRLKRRRADSEQGEVFVVGYRTAAAHQRVLQGATIEIGVPVRDFVR